MNTRPQEAKATGKGTQRRQEETKNTSSRIKVGYGNVNRSDTYTHTTLETLKDHDVVFISEPKIFTSPNNPPGCVNHPDFNRVTFLRPWTKVVAYVHKKRQSYKSSSNDGGTQATISFHLTHITGLYIPNDFSAGETTDLLLSLGTSGRRVILGDFNAHHPAWGTSKTNPRGKAIQVWSTARGLTQHNNIHQFSFQR